VKVAAHSEDIDGISSAALFLIKFPEAEIRFLSVYEAQQTEEEFDYSVDLPKTKNTKINIDHHKSNYERLINEKKLSKSDMIDPNAPSAASLVIKYLGLEDNQIAKEIVEMANQADTGNLNEKLLKLDRVIKYYVTDQEKLRKIAEALARYGKNFEKDEWLAKQIEEVEKVVREYDEKIKARVKELVSRGIKYAIFDATKVPFFVAKEAAHIFSKKGGHIGVSVYIDPVSKKLRCSIRMSKKCNISAHKLAEKMGGGGHSKAAGAIIGYLSKLISALQDFIPPNELLVYVKI